MAVSDDIGVSLVSRFDNAASRDSLMPAISTNSAGKDGSSRIATIARSAAVLRSVASRSRVASKAEGSSMLLSSPTDFCNASNMWLMLVELELSEATNPNRERGASAWSRIALTESLPLVEDQSLPPYPSHPRLD